MVTQDARRTRAAEVCSDRGQVETAVAFGKDPHVWAGMAGGHVRRG